MLEPRVPGGIEHALSVAGPARRADEVHVASCLGESPVELFLFSASFVQEGRVGQGERRRVAASHEDRGRGGVEEEVEVGLVGEPPEPAVDGAGAGRDLSEWASVLLLL